MPPQKRKSKCSTKRQAALRRIVRLVGYAHPRKTPRFFSEQDTCPFFMTESTSEPAPVLESDPTSEPTLVIKSEPTSEHVSVVEPESTSELPLVNKSEPTTEPVSVLEPEPTSEPVSVVEPEPTTELALVIKSEPTTEPVSVLEPEPTSEAMPVIKSEPSSELVPAITSESTFESVPVLKSEPRCTESDSKPAVEPTSEMTMEVDELNIMDVDFIIVDDGVQIKTSSVAPETSINNTDGSCSVTLDECKLFSEDSSDGLDTDIDNDTCAFPLRNAAAEPACDTDMTELQKRVLRTEDEANDRALHDLIKNEVDFQFDWTKDRQTFTGQREIFTGISGPTFDVTDMTPIDLFHKMFDKDFIDRLCTETNRYAEQKLAILKSKNKSPKSRLHRWTPTDHDEMITFLAILILQGLYPNVEEEKYFSFNGFGTMPYFSRIMSFNRFFLLKSMYHFVNNQTINTNKTELSKIQPVIDYLNDKFSAMYMPFRDITIDDKESLMKWKGRLSFAQKIASKAEQVGVKTCELCDTRTGYIWKFFVYAGKKTNDATKKNYDVTNGTDYAINEIKDETNGIDDAINGTDDETADPSSSVAHSTNATAKIALNLLEPLLHRGHTVIMDNFYNSPLLLRFLKKHKTDCYGTIRLNREFVPDSLKTLTKTDLRQGGVVTTYCSDLSMMVWRDFHLVSMISTYHQLQIENQNKYNRRTFKPRIVLDYNKSMGGADKKDQFLSAQPMERPGYKVWYKQFFARLLNTSIFNLCIIFQIKYPKISHRQFRTILAEGLLKHHAKIDLSTEPRLYTNKNNGQLMTRSNSRPPIVDHDHFPARSKVAKARCRVCAQNKRDSRTTWKCIQCNVSLCIEFCFREYHKNPKT